MSRSKNRSKSPHPLFERACVELGIDPQSWSIEVDVGKPLMAKKRSYVSVTIHFFPKKQVFQESVRGSFTKSEAREKAWGLIKKIIAEHGGNG